MNIIFLMKWTHITAGFCALVLGGCNLLFQKGTNAHKKRGYWYFYLMLINAILGILLATLNRPDSGYVVTFTIIIIFMFSGIGDFVLKRNRKLQNNINYLIAFGACVCLYFSYDIIAATQTELPLMTLRVYCIATIIAFLCAPQLHPVASHAMKMELSLIIAFSGMANNSLTHLVSQYHNSVAVISFLLIIFPFRIYHISKRSSQERKNYVSRTSRL